MNSMEVIEICRESVWVLIKVSMPLMLVALVVGLAVSLFQALTQIQEQTLTFVPKMLAIFATLLLSMSFILTTLIDFTMMLNDKIIAIQ